MKIAPGDRTSPRITGIRTNTLSRIGRNSRNTGTGATIIQIITKTTGTNKAPLRAAGHSDSGRASAIVDRSAWRALTIPLPLHLQQRLLSLPSPAIPVDIAIFAHYAMAGNRHRDGIRGTGTRHGAASGGLPDRLRHFPLR